MDAFDYLSDFTKFAQDDASRLVGCTVVTLQAAGGAEPNQKLPVACYSRGALKSGTPLPGTGPDASGLSR